MNDCLKARWHTKAIKCQKVLVKYIIVIVENNEAIDK